MTGADKTAPQVDLAVKRFKIDRQGHLDLVFRDSELDLLASPNSLGIEPLHAWLLTNRLLWLFKIY